MSDHDTTLPPETDDEIRARLRSFAEEVKERVDTETALQRMPLHSRPLHINLLAIAACLLAVVALAAVVTADRQSVDTTDPSISPTPTTDCPSTTQPRAITQGAQMNKRFATVASAATAIMLLSACSDDSPTTLAEGEDIDFVGSSGLGVQTMDITAQEKDGDVTGEVSFEPHGTVASLQCADTETDGVTLIGGEFTVVPDENDEEVGQWITVVIREGDPDSAFVWFADLGTEAPTSCDEALEQVPDPGSTRDAAFIEVEDGDNIETG